MTGRTSLALLKVTPADELVKIKDINFASLSLSGGITAKTTCKTFAWHILTDDPYLILRLLRETKMWSSISGVWGHNVKCSLINRFDMIAWKCQTLIWILSERTVPLDVYNTVGKTWWRPLKFSSNLSITTLFCCTFQGTMHDTFQLY